MYCDSQLILCGLFLRKCFIKNVLCHFSQQHRNLLGKYTFITIFLVLPKMFSYKKISVSYKPPPTFKSFLIPWSSPCLFTDSIVRVSCIVFYKQWRVSSWIEKWIIFTENNNHLTIVVGKVMIYYQAQISIILLILWLIFHRTIDISSITHARIKI